MKFAILIYLTIIFNVSNVLAGLPPTTTKGQNDTTPQTTFNIQAPNNTKTQIGPTTALIETGNNELLVNPSFEHSTVTTGWTLGTGSVGAAETSVIHAGSGKQALKVTMTSVNGDSLYQDVTPAGSLQGTNLAYAVWINANNTSNLQFCQRLAGADVSYCSTVVNDAIYHPYLLLAAGPSSGSVGWVIKTTSSTSGSYYVDDGHLMDASKYIGQGVPPNTYTAQISLTGVISSQSPSGWLSSCSTGTGTINCVPTTGNFSVAPNCIPAPNTAGGAGYSVGYVTASATASSLPFALTSGGSASNAFGIIISCQKATNDFVQNAITPNTLPQYWSGYMTGTGWTSTSTSGYVDMAAGTSISVTTNQSRNMTCTAASGSLPGITCTPNVTGIYYACTNFAAYNSGAANTTIFGRLLEATANVKVNDGVALTTPSSTGSVPFTECGLFPATAGSSFTLKVQSYSSSGTTTINAPSTSPLSFTVAQWSGGVTAPWLLGSVTSNSTNALKMEAANVNNTSGSAAVNSSTSSWITASTCSSAGSCPYTISGFSSAPYCTCSTNAVSAVACAVTSITSSGFNIVSFNAAGTSGANENNVKVQCLGPR